MPTVIATGLVLTLCAALAAAAVIGAGLYDVAANRQHWQIIFETGTLTMSEWVPTRNVLVIDGTPTHHGTSEPKASSTRPPAMNAALSCLTIA